MVTHFRANWAWHRIPVILLVNVPSDNIIRPTPCCHQGLRLKSNHRETKASDNGDLNSCDITILLPLRVYGKVTAWIGQITFLHAISLPFGEIQERFGGSLC